MDFFYSNYINFSLFSYSVKLCIHTRALKLTHPHRRRVTFNTYTRDICVVYRIVWRQNYDTKIIISIGYIITVCLLKILLNDKKYRVLCIWHAKLLFFPIFLFAWNNKLIGKKGKFPLFGKYIKIIKIKTNNWIVSSTVNYS